MSPRTPNNGVSEDGSVLPSGVSTSKGFSLSDLKAGKFAAMIAGTLASGPAFAGAADYTYNSDDLETQYGVDLTSEVGGDWSRLWGVGGDLADATSPVGISFDADNDTWSDTIDLSLDNTGSWSDVTADFTTTVNPVITSYSSTQDKLLSFDLGGPYGYLSVGGYGDTGAKTSLDTYTGPSSAGAIDDPTGEVYGSDDFGSGLAPASFTSSGPSYEAGFDLSGYEEMGFVYNSDTQIGAFTDSNTTEVVIVDYSGTSPVDYPTGVYGWVSDPQPGSFKVQLASDFSFHELRDPTYGATSSGGGTEDTGTGTGDTGVDDTGTGTEDTAAETGDTGAVDTGTPEDTSGTETGSADPECSDTGVEHLAPSAVCTEDGSATVAGGSAEVVADAIVIDEAGDSLLVESYMPETPVVVVASVEGFEDLQFEVYVRSGVELGVEDGTQNFAPTPPPNADGQTPMAVRVTPGEGGRVVVKDSAGNVIQTITGSGATVALTPTAVDTGNTDDTGPDDTDPEETGTDDSAVDTNVPDDSAPDTQDTDPVVRDTGTPDQTGCACATTGVPSGTTVMAGFMALGAVLAGRRKRDDNE